MHDLIRVFPGRWDWDGLVGRQDLQFFSLAKRHKTILLLSLSLCLLQWVKLTSGELYHCNVSLPTNPQYSCLVHRDFLTVNFKILIIYNDVIVSSIATEQSGFRIRVFITEYLSSLVWCSFSVQVQMSSSASLLACTYPKQDLYFKKSLWLCMKCVSVHSSYRTLLVGQHHTFRDMLRKNCISKLYLECTSVSVCENALLSYWLSSAGLRASFTSQHSHHGADLRATVSPDRHIGPIYEDRAFHGPLYRSPSHITHSPLYRSPSG